MSLGMVVPTFMPFWMMEVSITCPLSMVAPGLIPLGVVVQASAPIWVALLALIVMWTIMRSATPALSVVVPALMPARSFLPFSWWLTFFMLLALCPVSPWLLLAIIKKMLARMYPLTVGPISHRMPLTRIQENAGKDLSTHHHPCIQLDAGEDIFTRGRSRIPLDAAGMNQEDTASVVGRSYPRFKPGKPFLPRSNAQTSKERSAFCSDVLCV
jgi:hypothetical protein